MWKSMVVLFIAAALMACAPKQVFSARLQVVDINNQPVHTLDDATSVAYVEKTLNNRIRVIVKKQPDFRYRLQWQLDGAVNQVWLYDGFGSVAVDGKEYEAIYHVDDVENLNRVLHVMVVEQP